MKKNNFLIALTFATHLFTSLAFANTGGHEGNGGMLFICANKKLKLVEAWEGEDLGYPVKLSENPNSPIASLKKEYIDRLSFFESGRAALYEKMFDEIMNDISILEKHPNPIERREQGIKTKWTRSTLSPLIFSLDSDFITQPAECPGRVQAITQKTPKTDGETLLTLDMSIWRSPDISNETRTLLIFHEINVYFANQLGILNTANEHTTEPARVLNRFIGAPDLAKKKTVCDYMKLLSTYAMGNRNASTLDSGIIYGSIFLPLSAERNSRRECWATTGRLKTGGAEDYTQISLRSFHVFDQSRINDFIAISKIHFSETSTDWISADIANARLDEDLIFGTKTNFTLSSGENSMVKHEDGSFTLYGMSRSQSGYVKKKYVKIEGGTADVDFNPADGSLKETVHLPQP